MSGGVDIPLGSMADLNQVVKDTVLEFEEARSATALLVESIGRPFQDRRLASRADAFEGQWDDKRETLKKQLIELQERIDANLENWPQLDEELRASLDDG